MSITKFEEKHGEVTKYQDILIFLLEQQLVIEKKLKEAKIEYEKEKLSVEENI